MEELKDIIIGINPKIMDYTGEANLLEAGIMDSLEMMELIEQIEVAFGIEIAPEDIVAENFKNYDAIVELVQKYQEQ